MLPASPQAASAASSPDRVRRQSALPAATGFERTRWTKTRAARPVVVGVMDADEEKGRGGRILLVVFCCGALIFGVPSPFVRSTGNTGSSRVARSAQRRTEISNLEPFLGLGQQPKLPKAKKTSTAVARGQRWKNELADGRENRRKRKEKEALKRAQTSEWNGKLSKKEEGRTGSPAAVGLEQIKTFALSEGRPIRIWSFSSEAAGLGGLHLSLHGRQRTGRHGLRMHGRPVGWLDGWYPRARPARSSPRQTPWEGEE